MTGFALVLWAYTAEHSALAVSLMTFCNYVPYIVVSLFAGTFVDRHRKKNVILIADSTAAVGTVIIWCLVMGGSLQTWHIYAVNALIGSMNAFQSPASGVAIGKMVPKEKLANVSGMAVMFLCTGTIGCLFSILSYIRVKKIAMVPG